MKKRTVIAWILALSSWAACDFAHGAQWVQFGLDDLAVRALEQDGQVLYAGTEDGVYRMTVSPPVPWAQVGLAGLDVRALLFLEGAPDIILAGVRPPFPSAPPLPDLTTVFRSTDGGDTWTPSDSGMHGAESKQFRVLPNDPSRIYTIGQGTVSFSIDLGLTWSQGNDLTLEISAPANGLAIAPSNPNRLYMAGSSGVGTPLLWMSDNAGLDWAIRNGDPFIGAYWAVEVDENDQNLIYVMSFGSLITSRDGGLTYEPIAPLAGGAPFTIHPTDPNRMYAGRAAQFESTNTGLDWEIIEPNFPGGGSTIAASMVFEIDGETLFVGTRGDFGAPGTGVYSLDLRRPRNGVDSMNWLNYP